MTPDPNLKWIRELRDQGMGLSEAKAIFRRESLIARTQAATTIDELSRSFWS